MWGGSAELDVAHKYYNCTKFEESLKVLDSIPNKDAAVFELTGRNYYMQGDYKKAVEALETALTHDPRNSMAALWLARAYGRRAETSSPFTAPGLRFAGAPEFRARRAIGSAQSGGAFGSFRILPGRARAFWAAGWIRRKRRWRESPPWTLPRHNGRRPSWRRSASSFRRWRSTCAKPSSWLRGASACGLELARFLARQGRFQEAEESFAHAERVAPGSPRVLFAKAEVYVKHSRNLEVAKQILQRYVSLALTPDDPPRAEAAKLLRQVQGS